MEQTIWASHIINPEKENLDEALEEITSGKLADISVEASGYPDALNAALRAASQDGKVIIFGNLTWAKRQNDRNRHTIFLEKFPTIIPLLVEEAKIL
ncbi:MAG: hypothetical protein CM1200mP38_2400 [Dehalococcoidia bacterium]|nr:MAG: hypothetical protein CM1200mP38_2400 [Dehalococcoidia bacterium]